MSRLRIPKRLQIIAELAKGRTETYLSILSAGALWVNFACQNREKRALQL